MLHEIKAKQFAEGGLEIATHSVERIMLGADTSWNDGALTIDPTSLERALVEETGLASIGIEIARPGTRVRIIHVLDAIEPRIKSAGGDIFPGFFGRPLPSGTGTTHALEGMAVIVTGEVPGLVDSQLVSEAIIDMAGPAAPYSPFSATQNLVLSCRFRSEQDPIARVAAARRAGLLAARMLALTAIDAKPSRVEQFDLAPRESGTPRVVYICPAMKLSELHQSHLFGAPVAATPAIIHPAELFDGALVSGNYDIASTRNPTYFHQRNPIVLELYQRHARGELDFAGVIVTLCLHNSYLDKERSAHLAARAAKLLGASGAILSIEECGHSYADLMLTCQACEDLGVQTVLIMAESAGASGDKPAALVLADDADALVSAGNMDQRVALPEMESVIGGSSFIGRWPIASPVIGPAETTLENIFASTCQVGPSKLRAIGVER